MINLVIIEDDREFAGVLRQRLDGERDLSCRAVFGSVEDALVGAPPLAPHVALLDLHLPGESGIVGAGRLRDLLPDTRILMLTVCDDYDEVFAALAAGADGYLLKADPPERIVEAVREVAEGGGPFSPAIARMVVRYFHDLRRQSPDADVESLTKREEEVVRLAANGLISKEIAAALGIKARTVDAHFDSIRKKLRAENRKEAVARWLQDQKRR